MWPESQIEKLQVLPRGSKRAKLLSDARVLKEGFVRLCVHWCTKANQISTDGEIGKLSRVARAHQYSTGDAVGTRPHKGFSGQGWVTGE